LSQTEIIPIRVEFKPETNPVWACDLMKTATMLKLYVSTAILWSGKLLSFTTLVSVTYVIKADTIPGKGSAQLMSPHKSITSAWHKGSSVVKLNPKSVSLTETVFVEAFWGLAARTTYLKSIP